MSAPPRHNGALDPAAAAELAATYKALWTSYKLAVTGLYFCGQPLSAVSGGSEQHEVFTWAPEPGSTELTGVQASEEPPLITFLQAPRLDPQLAAYVKGE